MSVVLQERDFQIQKFVADYGVVTRRQICRELSQPDRSIRRRLAQLSNEGFLKRHSAPSCDGMNSIPVYASTRKGLQFLAEELEDDRYSHFPVGFPISQNLTHSVEVAETHILLTRALAQLQSPIVSMGFWFNEDQKVAPFEDPKKTTVMSASAKPTLCRPDAVFSLNAGGMHCAFFLEEDRATTWAQRVMKKKLPGFEHVVNTQAHREQFKAVASDLASTLRVVFVCPTDKRRDSLKREAERQLAGKDQNFVDCFRFVSKYGPANPLKADNILFEPIALRCNDDTPLPLVRLPEHSGTSVVPRPLTSPTGQGGQADGHPRVHVNA